ncbi:MAG: NAD(P)-dependent oxidoreductase [Blautia sp.]|nr:NAD(P)-dependent oxidoreductase [Blautia sp.]
MAVHVIDEAKRCLNCKKPMCRQGCPIHTEIPKMIEAFKNNRLNEAGDLLFSNNPLSVICSLVCNHERQCEGHCVLGRKGSPVQISSIEHYISDSCLDKLKIPCEPKRNQKAAVIGAGPAGLTIAVILAKLGYDITIFDAREKIGGVLQYGIPEYRLPKTILDRYRKKLAELGIRFRPNTTIGGTLEIEDLFRDGYRSIFIGTGVWRPKKLGIPGESLGNVHFGLDYLCSPDSFELGENVAVIGLGNTAVDAARTALRHGVRNVTLYGRGTAPKASEYEMAYAALDGAAVKYNKEPLEITDEGPVFRTVMRNEAGEITGYEEEPDARKADSVIIAISQGPKDKLVNTTPGLLSGENGLLLTDDAGHTTCPGVFAAGDVVKGARTVVEAVAFSKKVAMSMHRYMEENARCQDSTHTYVPTDYTQGYSG